MKKLLFSLALLLSVFLVNAQSTVTGHIGAEVIAPISISEINGLHFGQVASSDLEGVVEIDYSGNRTATGGATIVATSTTQQTGIFHITGEGNSSISVLIPDNPIMLAGPGSEVYVYDFVADSGSSTNLVDGSKDIRIKVKLHLPAKTAKGYYDNSTDFVVTVNYN